MKSLHGLSLILSSMVFSGSLAWASSGTIIPANRTTTWNPGLNAVGGIPHRTTIYTTINAATYGNGSQDATSAIQTALDSCPANKVVLLGPGTFKITGNGLNIAKSNITLRGSGPAQTHLIKPQGSGFPVIFLGTLWVGFKQFVNLAADAPKDAYSVTLTSMSSFSPPLATGEIVGIDQITDTLTDWGHKCPLGADCRGYQTEYNRPLGQMFEIASVNGTTVTFTTPIHVRFLTADSAHLFRFWKGDKNTVQPATTYSGIEDLHARNGEGGDWGGNFSLFSSAYCWVKNVEGDSSLGEGVNLISSFRCEVRDSYFHTTMQAASNGGCCYGIGLMEYASDNLIENNISWNFDKVMVMRGTGGGNVIGYNYFEDGYLSWAPAFVESGMNASHMTTPHMELFEGNQSFSFDGDATWGNSIYITAFRNHLTTLRRSVAPLSFTDEGNRRGIGIGRAHWWYSFVGNVIGYPEGYSGYPSPMSPQPQSSQFIYEWTGGDAKTPIWYLGYDSDSGSKPPDPKVLATTIRYGNYDYFTKTQKWDSTISDHALPVSYYLTKKPAFFGTCPWPWVTPDSTSKVAYLPARARFDSLHFNTPCPVCMSQVAGTTMPPAATMARTFGVFPQLVGHRMVFEYAMPAPGNVHLEIIDIRGRRICTLAEGRQTAGQKVIEWNTQESAAGIYLCRLAADGVVSGSTFLIR